MLKLIKLMCIRTTIYHVPYFVFLQVNQYLVPRHYLRADIACLELLHALILQRSCGGWFASRYLLDVVTV